MGARIRAHRWPASLGPPATWPAPLKTLVGVMLASQQPKFIAWGPDRIWFNNDAFTPILGDKHPNALGRPAMEVWGEARDMLEPLFARVFAGEAVQMDDFALPLLRNGKLEDAHFAFAYTPVRLDDGHVIGLFGNCIETTAQIRTQHELERKVIERTQARGRTWQVSPDLMGALNAKGYFETSNPAWRTVLGWSEEEVASMSIFELLHPDDVERTRAGFELTQQGQPAIQFPNRYRCKDGSYRWISWVGVPEDGMVYCSGRDITAEKALQDSEDQFRTMAQAMPNHVWTSPADGLLDWFNDRVYEFSGAARGTLNGNDWAVIVHPDDLPAAAARWAEALSTGVTYEAEFRLRRADGLYRWHIARAAPIKDASGRVVRWIGTNTDIEDERQIGLRLRLLISELNHRVKNLFALVGGLVSLSARGATTAKELASALQGRLQALSQAHELIQPGLRAEDAATPSGVDLAGVIGKIFAPYMSSHPDGRVEIAGPNIKLSAGAVTGMALIFHELATNAAKYGALHENGGKVAVTWDIVNGVLILGWLESGCRPRVSEPERTGFGGVLLQRSIEGQFGGTMNHAWKPDGLAITITAPLSRFSER